MIQLNPTTPPLSRSAYHLYTRCTAELLCALCLAFAVYITSEHSFAMSGPHQGGSLSVPAANLFIILAVIGLLYAFGIAWAMRTAQQSPETEDVI